MDPPLAHAMCDAPDPVAAFCRDDTLWGAQAGDERLVRAIRDATGRVQAFLKEPVP
jgi:D-arabinitol 4-dehydrogenase